MLYTDTAGISHCDGIYSSCYDCSRVPGINSCRILCADFVGNKLNVALYIKGEAYLGEVYESGFKEQKNYYVKDRTVLVSLFRESIHNFDSDTIVAFQDDFGPSLTAVRLCEVDSGETYFYTSSKIVDVQKYRTYSKSLFSSCNFIFKGTSGAAVMYDEGANKVIKLQELPDFSEQYK